MKSHLQEYLDEFVLAKDYDVNNPLDQSAFYQEGGFARFTPGQLPQSALSQMPMPIIGNIQAPKLDQHELWNSVGQNISGAARTWMAGQELKMRREQNAIDNDFKVLDMAFKREQLEEQKRQFGINSTMDQIKLMTTVTDTYLNKDILASDTTKYGDVLNKYAIPTLMKNANTPEGLMELTKGLAAMTGDEEYRRISGNVLLRDQSIDIYKSIPTDMYPYILNNAEFLEGLTTGVVPPKLQFDKDGYTKDAAATRQMNLDFKNAQAANYRAQAVESEYDAMWKGAKRDELVIANNLLTANLKKYEGDPEKQMQVYQDFFNKHGSSAGATLQDPSNVWEAIAYFQRQNMSLDKAITEALKIQGKVNTNQVGYFGSVGGDPGDPPVITKIGGNLISNNPYIGKPVVMDSSIKEEVASALKVDGVDFYSPDATSATIAAGTHTPVVVDADDKYTIGTYKMNGQNGDTEYDGTMTVYGTLRTKDYAKAKTIDPTVKQKEVGDWYEVTVATTTDASPYAGGDIRGQTSKTAVKTPTVTTIPPTKPVGSIKHNGVSYNYGIDKNGLYIITNSAGKVVDTMTEAEFKVLQEKDPSNVATTGINERFGIK